MCGLVPAHKSTKGGRYRFADRPFLIKTFRKYDRKPLKQRDSTDSRLRGRHGGDRFTMNTNKTPRLHTDYTKLSYPLLKKFGELLTEIKSKTVRGDQL